MPRPYQDSVICGACGKESTVSRLASTSMFGSPDLDTRPPQPARGALMFEVQTCENCGLCAGDISEAYHGVAGLVRSEEYRAVLSDTAFPEKARQFLCAALVAEATDRLDNAAWAAIRAAWTCDDNGDERTARECRLRAIVLMKAAKAAGQSIGKGVGAFEGILSDLQRRSGLFDDALKTIEAGLAQEPSEVVQKVLVFAERLAEANDATCRQVVEAMG
jgi:hypothetical protein